MRKWLRNLVSFDPESALRFKELYAMYLQNCSDVSTIPLGSKSFAKVLRNEFQPEVDSEEVCFRNRAGLTVCGVKLQEVHA